MNDLLHQPLLSAPDDNLHSFNTVLHNDLLANFFNQVDLIKLDIQFMDQPLHRLQESKEKSKRAHTAQSLKMLREQMDNDLDEVLERARSIKNSLDRLDEANSAGQDSAGCEKGSSVDRVRMFVTSSLRQKLKEFMVEFEALRQSIRDDYKEIVERRYYTLTGQQPGEEIVDQIIETGDSEDFLRRAIEQQGRGQVIPIIQEIHERHDTIKEIEENLLELHQLFLDMSVLVEAQGEELDDIEKNMLESASFVKAGTEQLNATSKNNINTRKWVILVLIFLLIVTSVVTFLIVFFVVRSS